MAYSDPETWKDIPGHPGYQASTHGRIRSLDRVVYAKNGPRNYRGKILATSANARGGHLSVNLGYEQSHRVHKLVALTYIGPCPDGLEVRHTPDTDPTNNCPDNLAYGTRSDNMRDRIADGNNPQLNRTHCPQGHPYEGDNLKLRTRTDGRAWRACVACSRASYIMKSNPGLTKQQASDLAYQRITTGKRWQRY